MCCASCGHRVADAGSQRHEPSAAGRTFANPHGVVFSIQLYRDVTGCVAVGEPTLEHTWFAGFAWSVALCRGCAWHLGWHFAGVEETFWALIEERVCDCGA